jgi:starch phosphorylase
MYSFLPRSLPAGLEVLGELALDLRWTWSHAGDALWRRLDADLWERTQNAWATLQNTSEQALAALAADAAFRSELERVASAHERYLAQQRWCQRAHPEIDACSVAYFSLEFGLGEAFPLYAGGLGVLAGDYLKTASDLGVPVVGVGLLYQEGYFRQMLDATGHQREVYPYNDPTCLPIQPVADAIGGWMRVRVNLPGRALFLRVWQAKVGLARLLLLDSNDLGNGAGDRGITAKLYGGGAEMRLLQEIALGVGGWSALDALGIAATVCHLNEGHAAFAIVERARRFMRCTPTTFAQAWWATRAGNVFTTHTPVAAAFDLFAPELIEQYFRTYLPQCGLSMADFLALGRKDPNDVGEPFNMAYLALRGCARANAVSELHGEVSRHLFDGLYPDQPEADVPIGHVTNGVHMPSWDSRWSDELWTRACGKERWLGTVENLAEALRAIDDRTLWELLGAGRADLIAYARERLAWQLGQRGAPAERIDEAAQVLDPNTLTIGFARRFVEYKRPNLLLRDPDRLARLLLSPRRPVQILVAGKAHPDDEAGKQMIHAWLEFVSRPDVRTRAVFLEDYDIALAQKLVQGVDLWINTPRRPWEACGTSGMKVLANGGLNLSTLDGWWAEAYTPDVGWAIGDSQRDRIEAQADAEDAERLYRLLEDEVVPLFYECDEHGIACGWVRRMRASISRLAPAFSSNRMLQQYVEELYLPAAAAFEKRRENGAALAKELAAWGAALETGWSRMHFGELRVDRRNGELHFRVPAYLGEIEPDAVCIELYADPVAGSDSVRQPMTRGEPIAGARNSFVYAASLSTSRPPSHFTPRIVPCHPHARVPAECPRVLWQR